MSTFSRSDETIRDERIESAWLSNFLQTLATTPTSSTPNTLSDILKAIDTKRVEGVVDVVRRYRKEVGLDLLDAADEGEDTVKIAASIIKPIAPMRLKKIESPDVMLKDYDAKDLIIQQKIDGFKTMGIKTDVVKVYTRRAEDFSANVPELVKELDSILPNDTFVLGELTWVTDEGKQSISDIQTVVGSKPDKAAEKIKDGGQLVFWVYDLLWLDGKDLTQQPYSERYQSLATLIKGTKITQLVKNYTYDQKDQAIKDALAVGGEGIVLKPKDSKYLYGAVGESERFGEWSKYKPGQKAHTDEVIVNSYERGEAKLIFPAYQYKGSELVEVGRLSGLPKDEEAKVKADIDKGKSVVVEVTYQERNPETMKFRHMGWSRRRDDKPIREVTMASNKALSIRCVAAKETKTLSIRQAQMRDKSVVEIVEADPNLIAAIESFCKHSGGHKSIHTIIEYLRERLGDIVSYNDDGLKEYIDGVKSKYKVDKEDGCVDPGAIGTERTNQYTDNTADYITHGSGGGR